MWKYVNVYSNKLNLNPEFILFIHNQYYGSINEFGKIEPFINIYLTLMPMFKVKFVPIKNI